MKKQSLLMTCLFASLAFTSCDKEAEVTVPQEASFTLDYTFMEHGSMTRATGAEVYGNFYDNYIKTKVLTPKTYSLTFTNKETGVAVTMEGCWDKAEAIRLMEGEYGVTGVSHPIANTTYPSDTVFLSFEESVSIVKDMDKLSLVAKYDSYLLMLDSANYKEAQFYHGAGKGTAFEKNLRVADDLLILFIRDFMYGNGHYDDNARLKLTRNDGHKITVPLYNIPFEKGKYYYFNDMTNSFDIPPMESGN